MKPVLIRHTKIANVFQSPVDVPQQFIDDVIYGDSNDVVDYGTTQRENKNEFDICLYIPPLRNRVGGGIGFRVNKSCTTSKSVFSVNIRCQQQAVPVAGKHENIIDLILNASQGPENQFKFLLYG